MPLHKLRRGSIKDPPTVTYITSSQSSSNLTTYTFSGVSIGTASADRIVVAIMTNSNGGSNLVRTLSSCTIGGNTATVAGTNGQGVAAGASVAWGVAYLLVPSGTTADIVFTLSGAPTNCQLHVFTVTRWRLQTPTLYTDTTRTLDWSISGQTLGAAIGGAIHNTATRTYTVTSTGGTSPVEHYDASIESSTGATLAFSVADVTDNPTVTATASGTTSNEAGVIAVWR